LQFIPYLLTLKTAALGSGSCEKQHKDPRH